MTPERLCGLGKAVVGGNQIELAVAEINRGWICHCRLCHIDHQGARHDHTAG